MLSVLHGDAEGDALDVVGDETARVATVALAVASAVARRREPPEICVSFFVRCDAEARMSKLSNEDPDSRLKN